MSDPLESVFISFEAVPFAKVGGLADVAGALPRALRRHGVETTLIVPRFPSVDPAAYDLEPLAIPSDWYVGIAWRHHPFRAWEGTLDDGVRVLLIDDDHYLSRPGVYTNPSGNPWPDELERYVFFAKGALELVKCLGARPHIVHLNDYQTALDAAWIRETYAHESAFSRCAIVYSVHNLAHQGVYPKSALPIVGLDAANAEPMGPLEFHGNLNLMKAGIEYADVVTTVSPTYAREIQTPEFGCGLDGLLRRHADKLYGILNGIDVTAWDPAGDTLIARSYTADDTSGKRACKQALMDRARLDGRRVDMPLIGMVGRLVPQKGIDLVLGLLDDLLRSDVNFVLLGSGAAEYEDAFRAAADRFPDRCGVDIGFDDEVAHQITAGADLFLMPSRYEPCGLNQMYAMRYGTLPVARRTGGLADTIVDLDEDPGAGCGFLFDEPETEALSRTVARALEAYWDRDRWARAMQTAMRRDFSWDASAGRYREVYETALENRRRFISG